jgi:hypothetical protein
LKTIPAEASQGRVPDLWQTLRDGCVGYDHREWIRQGGTMIEFKGGHFEQ